MLEAMNKLIRDLRLLPPGAGVLCAVSGGADSICLLHALYHLRPRLGFSLAAAHYDHQLRGEESRRDAAFVEQFVRLCCGEQRLRGGAALPAVPLFTGSGDVAGAAREWGVGIEEAARELRYGFLRRAAEEAGCGLIATAHTADDNAETILLHLARGAGLRGLGGIPPVREGVIRPLLTTTRREVEDYLRRHALPWREDRTNQDERYARNRIRRQVMPVLEELYPGFAARTADAAALLRADEDYLAGQAHEIARQALPTDGGLSIPAALIAQAPPPVASRAVRQLIGRLNGGDQDCAAVHLEGVIRLCRSGDPSAQVRLPDGLIARREYGALILTRACPPPPLEEQALPLPGEVVAGGWQVTCGAEAYTGQSQGPWDFWLAREMLSAPILRPRRRGDRLTLPGRPSKTVKKWFIDEKIPLLGREGLPVVDCGGRVAAVAGLGPDAAFLPAPGAQAWHVRVSARQWE